MKTGELFKLAFKAIFANKLRSFLTTLGIVIGVFSIIMLVSIGTGLQSYITNQVTGLGSNLMFVIPGKVGGRTVGGAVANKLEINDSKRLQDKLDKLAQVAPVIVQPTTLKYKNKTDKDVNIFGTTSNYPETVLNIKFTKGAFFSPGQERSGAKVAIVGATVEEKLFPSVNPIGKEIAIGNNRYTVLGVLDKRGSTFGVDQDNIAVVPIKATQQQFGLTNVNAIYISVFEAQNVALVKKQAETTLLKRLSEDDFTLQTAEAGLETMRNVTNILTLGLGGIAAISLLVGGIGVANIMLVSVTERTREIGLRKALGARRNDILKQFLLEAIILSVTGGIIGIALGMIASIIISLIFISSVTTWSILLAFGFSVLVGVVFGMTPAIRASKLSPIDALRYE